VVIGRGEKKEKEKEKVTNQKRKGVKRGWSKGGPNIYSFINI